MRSVTRAVALVVALACLMPSLAMAQGQDYITDAINALQQSPVYIAPDTENVPGNTEGVLRRNLTLDDRIVLVVLPSTAATDLDLDPVEIAASLSELLGDQRIIGLAVGTTVVGYAVFLPDNVAAELMQKADEISNHSPINALRNFVNYMHIWMAQNPDFKQTPTPVPTPTPTPEPTSNSNSTEEEKSSWPLMFVGMATVLVLIGGAVKFRRRQLHQVPLSVQDLLDQIAAKRLKVGNASDRKNLEQIGRYVEKYFRSTSKDRKADTLFFENNLKKVSKYLDAYLEAQEGSEFWSDPEALKADGGRYFSEFSDHVLNSIRRGTDERMPEFKRIANEFQALHRLSEDPTGLDEFERRLQSDNS